ncbi:MAG: hypothetical protein HQL35_15560 [Alphaproteobacteria bacterium]|nr:hypothetical protein [Alphaproteobacteria bacterium]
MADRDEMKFQSDLKRWEMMYQSALHSDRMAGDIGVFTLKTTIVTNGAALIAILAAYPNLHAEHANVAAVLPCAGRLFLIGLIAAMAAAAIAYFYQSAVTAGEWNKIHEAYPGDGSTPPPFPHAHKASRIIVYPMIGLAFLSFGLFCAGGWTLISGFATV